MASVTHNGSPPIEYDQEYRRAEHENDHDYEYEVEYAYEEESVEETRKRSVRGAVLVPSSFVCLPGSPGPREEFHVPDQRRHRGPHPEDARLFAGHQVPLLQAATRDLSWLLTRGYPPTAALKLVGDRYHLKARQRLAVARCACGEDDLTRRSSSKVVAADLSGEELWIDGYNVLTSVEAALSGGVILQARDGCYRDMASMHGSYRKVQETIPAIELIGQLLVTCQSPRSVWWLDQPVSNSGRLKALLQAHVEQQGWPWSVRLVANPDAILSDATQIVASADSQILNHAPRWFNLARTVIETHVPEAWLVDLSGGGGLA